MSKTINGEKCTYEYLNGLLLYETRGEKFFHYFYDPNGTLYGVNYKLTPNGTTYAYYFTHNWRGDIVGIYNGSANLVAEYEYDSWGNVTAIKNANGDPITNKNHVSHLNPFRYRGYYMDTETGMYYLMSRYYDPVTHRFLNADSQLNPGTGLLGMNVFAYANNNPIMYSDPTGHSILAFLGLGILIVGIIFGFSGDSQVVYSVKKINPNKKPNPESGYVPPKKNPNPGKVKNPNGQGRGWPDKDGGVWIPNNNQHGGPGWTVQYPGGEHEHRYPDGHIRTHKFNYDDQINNVILEAATILVSGVGIAVLVIDDTTVIGIMDNAAIPLLGGAVLEGVQKIHG